MLRAPVPPLQPRPVVLHLGAAPAALRGRLGAALALGAVMALAGCAPGGHLGVPRDYSEFDLPDQAAFGETGDPPVITLEVEPLRLRDPDMVGTGPVPDVLVGPAAVAAQPLGTLMELLLEGTGISYSIDAEAAEEEITLRLGAAEPLSLVMERIAEITGFHYAYVDGLLRVASEQDYVMQLPRMGAAGGGGGGGLGGFGTDPGADLGGGGLRAGGGGGGGLGTGSGGGSGTLDSLSTTFAELGADAITSDPLSGLVTFRANRREARQINDYLRAFWQTRDMIVYDIYVLEVSLDRNRDLGVAFDQLRFDQVVGLDDFELDASLLSPFDDTFSGVLISGSGQLGSVDVNGIIGFLQTQGEVRSLSKPQVTIISGGASNLSVGTTQTFIARVERSTNSETGDVTTSVETEKVESVVRAELSGAYSDGVVYTSVALEITDVLGFTEFSTGDSADSVALQLPIVAERTLETEAHARPGDVILIGGLIQEESDEQRDDLALINVPIRRLTDVNRSELVILIAPRVIKFRPADTHETAPPARAARQAAQPLPLLDPKQAGPIP